MDNEKENYAINPYQSQAECYRRLLGKITPLPHQLTEGVDYHRIKSKKHRLPRKEKKQLVKRLYSLGYGKVRLKKSFQKHLNAWFAEHLLDSNHEHISLVTYLEKARTRILDYEKKTSGFVALPATQAGRLLVDWKNGLPPSDFCTTN